MEKKINHWKCKGCKHKFVLTSTDDTCPQCRSENTFPANADTALEAFTKPRLNIWMKSRSVLSKTEINDHFSSPRITQSKSLHNNFLGRLGEAEAAFLFIKKGYKVTDRFPIDLVIRKNDQVCLVDVKTTSQDKWIPKKYFHNKQGQQDAFGYSLNEYLRVKILLEPYRVIFNEEDLEIIEKYFEHT